MKSFTMPVKSGKVITIKEVAVRARLSLATVSYALRADPKIPEATRRRVEAAAQELGYRPNPRVAGLMAHIRRAHAGQPGERIAFVWVHTSRGQAARDPFMRRVFSGARERAEQAGFTLEEFWTTDPGMTDRRLEEIIRARGIVGVVLSPVTTDEAVLSLEWNWEGFATAVIGNVTWTPELHHAGHHHFLGMRLALLELLKLGCIRPVALIEPESNVRAKRAWEAAFLAHHPTPARARGLVRIVPPSDLATTADWVRARSPDALIVSATQLLEAPKVRRVCRELGLPVATLYRGGDEPPEIGGIDQCYDRIAAHAVDLVIAQLSSNETGPPDLPRIILFPGRWIPPQVPRNASAR